MIDRHRDVEVEVKLYGVLRRHRPEGISGAPHHPFNFELVDQATVADLMARLAIPDGRVTAVAINGQAADEGAVLANGDEVRLFPPSAGGSAGSVFLAGVMQGSRTDAFIDDQSYRTRICAALEAHLPGVHIFDPLANNPDSVEYDTERARHTFKTNTALAAEADILIAYLPQASMGTAIEMWTAFQAQKYIIAVSPLTHNWVIRTTADELLPDLDSLMAAIEDGRLASILSRRQMDRQSSD